MVEPRSWRVLGGVSPDDNPDEVVLAADFPVTGRPEAGFTDLARGLGSGPVLWETVPPNGIPVSGSTYTRHWLAEVRDSGRFVRAVMGFCAGGVFAAALADGVAAWQRERPKILLFDPERPAAPNIYWQFHKVVDSLSAVLSAEERAQAQEAGQQAQSEHPELAEFGAALMEIFQRTGEIGFARAGLNERRRAELTNTFRSFVHYLVAAAEIDPDEEWASAITISSAEAAGGIASAKDFRFETGHVDLLRTPAVAETVAGLLSEG